MNEEECKPYLEEYKTYLIETLHSYAQYMQIDFLNILSENELIDTGRRKIENDDAIDLKMVPLEVQIPRCINQVSQAVNLFEKMEFERAYKYSVIFRYEIEYNELLQRLDNCPKVIKSKDLSGVEPLDNIPNVAIMDIIEDNVELKFSFKYDALDQDGNTKRIKYPVIVVFFKDCDLVEFRFDRIYGVFKNSKEFYARNNLHIQNWFKQNLNLDILDVDLIPILEKIQDIQGVVVYSQCMNSKAGGEATLKVNENYVLPFLGELENLMIEHEDKFSKAPEIKEILENYISEIKETSDLPWISLCWLGVRKSKNNIVKFSHNYMNKGYTLLQHYGLQKNMERMNEVVKCIADNREDTKTE